MRKMHQWTSKDMEWMGGRAREGPRMCNLTALTVSEAAAHLWQKKNSMTDFPTLSLPNIWLTDLGVISSPEITCFFIPYNQPLPNYICTLEHFTYTNSEESNITIADLFIHRHIPSPDAKVAIKVIDSIHVMSLNIAVLRTIMHTVWNVLVDFLLTLLLRDYFEWTNSICRLHFASEDYGMGQTIGHTTSSTPEEGSPTEEEGVMSAVEEAVEREEGVISSMTYKPS
ncbi:hypothetical protein BDR05DRAFT_950797 [Suillus weaverae]|nr:hypothetical protein BDR05DRAFT_950797 [Suillus weaverae]